MFGRSDFVTVRDPLGLRSGRADALHAMFVGAGVSCLDFAGKRKAEQIGLPPKGSDERQSVPARQFETSESLCFSGGKRGNLRNFLL